jgi:hypothetical protein
MLMLIAAPFLLFVCFVVQQKIVQHRMLEKLEQTSLQSISINEADIIWVKENKEALIDGKLFDVKSYSVNSNKITLTGLFDKDEDALKKDYASIFHSNKNESIPTNELVLKCMFVYVIINHNVDDSNYITNSNIEKKYLSFSQKSITQYLSVHTPPPNA